MEIVKIIVDAMAINIVLKENARNATYQLMIFKAKMVEIKEILAIMIVNVMEFSNVLKANVKIAMIQDTNY